MTDDWSTDVPIELVVGLPSNNQYIQIAATDIPPELIQYYTNHPLPFTAATIIKAWIKWVPDAFSYYYMIIGTYNDGTNGHEFFAEGMVVTPFGVGQVNESYVTDVNAATQFISYGIMSGFLGRNGNAWNKQLIIGSQLDTSDGTAIVGAVNLIDFMTVGATAFIEIQSGGSIVLDSGGVIEAKAGSFALIDSGAGYFIDGLDAPRGELYAESSTAGVLATSVAGTEVIIHTTASHTYVDGRAYRWSLRYEGTITVVPNRQTMRIRRFTLTVPPTGTILVVREIAFVIANAQQSINLSGILLAPSGGITEQINICILGGAAFNTAAIGQATQVFEFHVEDIGAAANYSGFDTW